MISPMNVLNYNKFTLADGVDDNDNLINPEELTYDTQGLVEDSAKFVYLTIELLKNSNINT